MPFPATRLRMRQLHGALQSMFELTGQDFTQEAFILAVHTGKFYAPVDSYNGIASVLHRGRQF